MSDPASHERLVEELARSLAPVRPLPGPGWRAVVWFSAVLALAILLLPLSDAASLQLRLGVPDLRYAALGAMLTSMAAVFAAFQSSVPGRSRAWALLPIPPLVVWLGVSGLSGRPGPVRVGAASASAPGSRGTSTDTRRRRDRASRRRRHRRRSATRSPPNRSGAPAL